MRRSPALTIRYCRRCGHVIDAAFKFCPHCETVKLSRPRWFTRRVRWAIGAILVIAVGLAAAYLAAQS
ncbi:MAG: hypothetical protein ACT4QC_11260 [Planctomycetaceae bacterium]